MSEKIEAEARAKTVADIEKDPRGVVKRWKAELALAAETEKEWRKEAKEVWELYEGKEQRANSFNILWSNTETLRPAVYNSTPQPDVRRRFRDPDPVGKAASTVLERALSYEIDTDAFDEAIQDAVLDTLIPGRGIARVRYKPTTIPQMDAQGQPLKDEQGNALEQLVDEKTPVDHVQWDDFRRGPGKRWKDVPWIAFRHDMNLDTLIEFFGEEMARKVPVRETDPKDKTEKEVKEVFRTAEVWEIWDKDQRRVLFICEHYAEAPLREEPDPLQLDGFWPIPRPMVAVENSRSLIPTPVYRLYKQQAKELDRVTARVNKIVDALKVRGAYSGNLPEVANIIDAGDNEMTPIANVSEVAAFGGLDKAIWIMPVDKLIAVLTGLYQARAEIKATIYEITGISDIIRGATEASETATAQRIKSQWGSLRLQKLQQEVQRFVRDLMRLMADVISTRFQPETLAQITQVKLPTGQEKQQAQMQLQQMRQMAQAAPMDPMTGQPAPMPEPPPRLVEMAQSPSWDEVMAVIRNDAQRCYKVDVETDSTVAETIERDMQGITEVVTVIGEIMGAAAAQPGMFDAAKQIALVMARHARMGSAVEDAIDSLQPPPPPPDPAMVAADQQAQADEQGAKQEQQVQKIVDQLMQAVQAPRKLNAQVDPNTGRIEGQLENAA